MADVHVTVTSDLSADRAWALASDLTRFDEWLTIFGGWRSDVPDAIEVGVTARSLIRVKRFRNTISWTVTEYEPPVRIGLRGTGRGGVRIALTMTVADRSGGGSEFDLRASLGGGVLSGPVGRLVAKVIESDVRTSVRNLAALD